MLKDGHRSCDPAPLVETAAEMGRRIGAFWNRQFTLRWERMGLRKRGEAFRAKQPRRKRHV